MDKMRQSRLAKDVMARDWVYSELDLGVVAAHAGYSRFHLVSCEDGQAFTPGRNHIP